MTTADPLQRFAGVERVVADPLRFKLKLRIGEDAYSSLMLRKNLSDVWEIGGAAATGAGAAASPIVASTFFASTASGGLLSLVGLGTAAATPIGWVVAAALASGGAYYGVTNLVRKFSASRVDTIPKFINTPLDLLAASLLDLIGGLAARIATIDGEVAPAERTMIAAHFIEEWGLDPTYVEKALDLLFAEANDTRVKQLAAAVAAFQASNPDCNADAMSDEIITFLRELAMADDKLDEREELAIDAVATVFREQRQSALTKVRGGAEKVISSSAGALRSSISRVTSQVRGRS